MRRLLAGVVAVVAAAAAANVATAGTITGLARLHTRGRDHRREHGRGGGRLRRGLRRRRDRARAGRRLHADGRRGHRRRAERAADGDVADHRPRQRGDDRAERGGGDARVPDLQRQAPAARRRPLAAPRGPDATRRTRAERVSVQPRLRGRRRPSRARGDRRARSRDDRRQRGPGARARTRLLRGGRRCRGLERDARRRPTAPSRDNRAANGGGGIHALVTATTIVSTTVDGNRAENPAGLQADGGGILARGGDTLIRRSTISDNVAGHGGGIAVDTELSTIANTTISGNRAEVGGGIVSDSGLALLNVTVVGNAADAAGGLWIANPQMVVRNTIIAGNTAAGDPARPNADCATAEGEPVAGDHNLFGLGTGCRTPGDTGVAPASVFADVLGPLAANAPGSTETHALLAGSPAVDTGDAATCAGADVGGVDQRGVAREAACDIGAFAAPHEPRDAVQLTPTRSGRSGRRSRDRSPGASARPGGGRDRGRRAGSRSRPRRHDRCWPP